MKEQVPEIIHSKYAIQCIDSLFKYPLFHAKEFMSKTTMSVATRRKILIALQEHGIISVLRAAQGRRAALLMFPDLIIIVK